MSFEHMSKFAALYRQMATSPYEFKILEENRNNKQSSGRYASNTIYRNATKQ